MLRGSAKPVASSNLFCTRRYSDQIAGTTKKSQFAVCDRTSLLSVNKKIIIKKEKDNVQPSISRTKIKGTLVFNEGGGGGGTLMFSYLHRLWSFVLGSTF